jgi:hypothetical protein
MGIRMVQRAQAAGAVATLVLAAAVASGCGGAGAATADDARVADNPPDVIEGSADLTNSRPAKPEVLELAKGGHPTVFVKIKKKVDLYDTPDGKVVETVDHATEFGSRTVFAVREQRGDWISVPTAFTENGELLWLRLDPTRLRAGRTNWEVEVDLSDYRADLILKGKTVRSFSVTIGMPGAPTPTGRFAVTDTFRGGLNPAYGCCAVALTARQSKLPSGWLGGDRIAFHGTDGPLSAALSHGCVRASDEDVSELVDRVPPGTPVTIRQ